MPAADLKNMGVDALLAVRADVESLLAERAGDLQRQIALLDGSGRVAVGKRRGRPPGGAGRASAMKGAKVPPKYRGPDGETWAGRGATPRWLSALLKEGYSIEEFAIAQKGGKAAAAAGKKVTAKKRGRKPAGKRKRG
jgi:DNA-binding protein H-NS